MMRNLLDSKRRWEKRAGSRKNATNELEAGKRSNPKGLQYFVSWLPGGKRKPDAGMYLAGGSCETRCFSSLLAIHPNRSMTYVVSAASIPLRSIAMGDNC